MLILGMKNYNININREAAKNMSYHQSKLINMTILQGKKYYLLIKNK